MRSKGFEPSQALSQQILSLSRLTTPATPHLSTEWENRLTRAYSRTNPIALDVSEYGSSPATPHLSTEWENRLTRAYSRTNPIALDVSEYGSSPATPLENKTKQGYKNL